jgi:hypothetical protein
MRTSATRRGAAGTLTAVLAAGLVAASLPAGAASGPVIRTIAGGVGGPGRAATVSIGAPCGLTWSGHRLLTGTLTGNGGEIRSVDTGTSWLTNLAGAGLQGHSPDGTSAAAAKFFLPCDAVLDHDGNVVFSDSSWVNAARGTGYRDHSGNLAVRVLAMTTGEFYGRQMTRGRIYTIAGDGTFGNTGDGGPATAAEISIPVGLAIDAAGNVVVGTAFPTGRIRVIAESTGTFYGQAMTKGDIYTVAGGGDSVRNGASALGTEFYGDMNVADGPAGVIVAETSLGVIRLLSQ